MIDFSPRQLLQPHIDALDPYKPIQPLEILSKRLGIAIDEIVKLDANENPYGPLPAVTKALAAYKHYHIYPDPQQTQLREALAHYIGVSAELILPGHGADELIDYLCRVFLQPGDTVINCPPTFGMYEFDSHLQGAQVVDVPRLEGYELDVDAMVAVVRANVHCKLLFLTSPNNPTGNRLSDEDLVRLLELPVMVVLDEAYVEFSGKPDRSRLVSEYENLCILRTFSKAAGIAGLRLGYGILPGWLIDLLWKFKQPYNVNVAASIAGLASLRHADEIAARVDLIIAERARLMTALAQIPWIHPYPSDSNFILCRVSEVHNAGRIQQSLESRGILVRHYNKTGLENCIRISVGLPAQTDRLIDALKAIEG